jgi:hypothetical protein
MSDAVGSMGPLILTVMMLAWGPCSLYVQVVE